MILNVKTKDSIPIKAKNVSKAKKMVKRDVLTVIKHFLGAVQWWAVPTKIRGIND